MAILGAYLSGSMGWLAAGRVFQAANLLEAGAFIINGNYHEAWPSVVTNVAWFGIPAVALLRRRTRKQLPGVPDTTGPLAVVDCPASHR